MASLRIAMLLILISAGNAAPAQAPQAIAPTPSEMVFSTDGLALPGMGQLNLVGDPTKPGPLWSVSGSRWLPYRCASTPRRPGGYDPIGNLHDWIRQPLRSQGAEGVALR